MTERVSELADNLDEYSSGRGHFDHIDEDGLLEVSRWLVIAKEQVRLDGDNWKDAGYRSTLRKVKDNYFYTCGECGVPAKEASVIWWSYVYDGEVAPLEREKYI